MSIVRFATYNVRHGQGVFSAISLARTARSIAAVDACVVSLNELYRLPGRYDQPAILARLTGMHVVFQPLMRWGRMEYGNAMLSHEPLEPVLDLVLPSRREPRGLLVVRTNTPAGPVTVGATHLALHRPTRALQIETIARAIEPQLAEPLVLSGDFNCGAGELAPLASILGAAPAPPPTYPSLSPFTAYDHILWSEHWSLSAIGTHRTLASDHVPLFADLER